MNYIPPLLLEQPIAGDWTFTEATRNVTGHSQLEAARAAAQTLSGMRNALWRQDRSASPNVFWRYLGALDALAAVLPASDSKLGLAAPESSKAYLARGPEDAIAFYAHLNTEQALVLGRLAARLVAQAQLLVGRLPLGQLAGPGGPEPAHLEDFASARSVLQLAGQLLERAASERPSDVLPECILGDASTLRDLAREYSAYAHEIAFYGAIYESHRTPFSLGARIEQSAALGRAFGTIAHNYRRGDDTSVRLRARENYWLAQAHRFQMRALTDLRWDNHAEVSVRAGVDRTLVCTHIASLDASNAAMARCLELIDTHIKAFPAHIHGGFFETQGGQLADRTALHADLAQDVGLDATNAFVTEGNAVALPDHALPAPRVAESPAAFAAAKKQFPETHPAFFALFDVAALGGVDDQTLVRDAWSDRALLQPANATPMTPPADLALRPWHQRIVQLLQQLLAHDASPTDHDRGLAAGALMERLAWIEFLLDHPAQQHNLSRKSLEAQVLAVEAQIGHVRAHE